MSTWDGGTAAVPGCWSLQALEGHARPGGHGGGRRGRAGRLNLHGTLRVSTPLCQRKESLSLL